MPITPPRFSRLPMENAARALNRSAGLYLSESQLRGLAVGLFVGTIAGVAALSWATGAAVRRLLK